MRLDHLVSLTFGCSYDYALGEDSMHIGWIIDTGNSGIEYEQHRMLGLDDDGNPTYPYYAIKSMVAAWQAKKSFKLYAEAKVYDLYDKRSRVLPLVARLGVEAEEGIITSQDYPTQCVSFHTLSMSEDIEKYF